jgi:hypothetical protein
MACCAKGLGTLVITAALGLSAACRDTNLDPTTPPPANGTNPVVSLACGRTCVFADGTDPLRSATYRADSASALVPLGFAVVSGSAGDVISLRVDVSPELLTAIGGDERVVINVDGVSERLPLSTLTAGVRVYTFRGVGTAHLSYSLTRGVARPVSDGQFRVTQDINNAKLVAFERPWMPSTRFASLFAPGGCVINAASQTVCNIPLTVTPFSAPPINIGGTFTSQHNTSASLPITIVFTNPVRLIFVKIYDPTFSGNAMVAHYGTGADSDVAAVSFKFSGTPGVNHPDTQTITFRGIRQVDLNPALNDFVSYDASFEADTCPPTGDPIIDTPEVQNALKAALAHSNPGGIPGTGAKLEHGGFIWQRPNGTFVATENTDPNHFIATECTYAFTGQPMAPDSGDFVVALYHTHPSSSGEKAYQCVAPSGQPPYAQFPGDGKYVPRADPDADGGGSPADWKSANNDPDIALNYIINRDGRVYKLVRGTGLNSHVNAMNKWEWMKPQIAGCMTH